MSDGIEINEYRLLLSKADLPISGPIEHSDVTLTVRGAIKAVNFEDTEEGTFDRVHKFVPKSISLIKENGDTIKSKDTRGNTKLLIGQIEMLRREHAPEYDQDAFRDRCMVALRHKLAEILATEGII